MPVRIFLHGLESSNQGTKALFFRDHYPDMIIPHFQGGLQERMEKLRGILSGLTGIIMVGSSFGGLMATLYAMENPHEVERLVLLAPAIHKLADTPYGKKTLLIPVWLYHGVNDEVIPMEEVERFARRCFPHLSFYSVEDDHFLHKTFQTIDWDGLLT